MTVRIGEAARRSGLSIHALRFYERKGLLPRTARGASNYREFSSAALERIRFIRDAQQLGFTLAEVRQLLSLRVADGDCCRELRGHAQRKLRELDERIRALLRVKAALEQRLRSCDPAVTPAACPAERSLASLQRKPADV